MGDGGGVGFGGHAGGSGGGGLPLRKAKYLRSSWVCPVVSMWGWGCG